MKTAHWRQHCSPVWSKQSADWLKTRGSLTVRLQATHGGFRVEVRRQGTGTVLADEARAMGVRVQTQVRLRQVTLWAGDRPRVVAHTAVRWLGLQSDWPFWRQLGSRSLGTVLFRDRRVQRSPLQFAKLPSRHVLARQAAQASGHSGPWLARRALYKRASGRTPLMVTEVFLSADTTVAAQSLVKD